MPCLPGWEGDGTSPGKGGGGSGSICKSPEYAGDKSGVGGWGKLSIDGDPVDEPSEDLEECDEFNETLKLVDRAQIRGGTTFLGEVEGVTEPATLLRVWLCFTEKE